MFLWIFRIIIITSIVIFIVPILFRWLQMQLKPSLTASVPPTIYMIWLLIDAISTFDEQCLFTMEGDTKPCSLIQYFVSEYVIGFAGVNLFFGIGMLFFSYIATYVMIGRKVKPEQAN